MGKGSNFVTFPPPRYPRAWVWLAVLALVPPAVLLLASASPWQFGHGWLSFRGLAGCGAFLAWLVTVWLILLLPAIALGLFAVAVWPRQRQRRQYAQRAFVSLALGAACVGACALMEPVGQWAGRSLKHRAQPVVDAINAYEGEHGQPPPSLPALVPGYLRRVPGTGPHADPELHYEVEGPKQWSVWFSREGFMEGQTWTYRPRERTADYGGGWSYSSWD